MDEIFSHAKNVLSCLGEGYDWGRTVVCTPEQSLG